MQFTISILDESDGWLVGQLRELPDVLSQGRSEAELIENLRDALREYLASFEEENPAPAQVIREIPISV